MNIKEVRLLIGYARNAIKAGFNDKDYNPKEVPESLKVKRGVFITLEKHPSKALRGCIGIIEPIKPLYKAVIDSAKSAAFLDPRFNELREDEFDRITIEISILSVPEQINGDSMNYPDKIRIGEHGLIIELGLMKGLLLPQVATEWGVNSLQFLEMTCEKAGLPKSSWTDPRINVYTFKAELFREEEPGGRVVNS